MTNWMNHSERVCTCSRWTPRLGHRSCLREGGSVAVMSVRGAPGPLRAWRYPDERVTNYRLDGVGALTR